MTAPRLTPGPILFVRYAFPPNHHGYCGPADSQSFFEYGAGSVVDDGLRALAKQFAGAWPYLELIAGATGIRDPLDRRVVEAYWVGNSLLDQVGTRPLGDSMEERFRHKTGLQFASLAESVVAGGIPHHSYHRETAVRSLDGAGLVRDLAVDDWVSLHWEWICDRLSARQLGALRHYTQYHLTLVNERLDHPGATAALG